MPPEPDYDLKYLRISFRILHWPGLTLTEKYLLAMLIQMGAAEYRLYVRRKPICHFLNINKRAFDGALAKLVKKGLVNCEVMENVK